MRTRFPIYILPALKISFAAAIIYYLIVGGALDFGPILALLGERIGVVLGAAAVAFTALILGGVRWWMVMRAAGLRLEPGVVVRVHLIGAFFSTWLPGALGGDAARGVYIVRVMEARRTTALLTVVIDRLFSLLGLATVLVVLVGLHLGRSGDQSILTFYGVFTLVIMLLAVSGGVLVYLAAVRLRFGDRPWFRRVRPCAQQLHSAVVLIGSARATLLLCAFLATVASGVGVLGVVVLSTGFAFAPDPIVTGLAAAVATLSSAIPLTPGGLGIAEMAFATVCREVASASGPVAAIYLSFRIVVALASCPGLFAWLLFRSGPADPQGSNHVLPGGMARDVFAAIWRPRIAVPPRQAPTPRA